MKLLRQFGIILAIGFIGEMINIAFDIPIPGSVIGMVLLFTCLASGIVKLTMVDEISRFLLDHLAFFFIPAGVGLIAYMDVLKSNAIAILTITISVTFVVMAAAGYTVQLLLRRSR